MCGRACPLERALALLFMHLFAATRRHGSAYCSTSRRVFLQLEPYVYCPIDRCVVRPSVGFFSLSLSPSLSSLLSPALSLTLNYIQPSHPHRSRSATINALQIKTTQQYVIHQAAILAGAAGAATVAAAEPDESLVQALHRMGISSNRARRACVATRNASREAALAWCVEHSADPAMDAPFVSSGRRSASGRPMGVGTVGGGGGGGNAGDGDVVGQRRGEEALRVAARLRGIAAAALEAYVRARLSAIGESSGRGGGSTGGGGGGGDVGLEGSGVPSEEIGELVAVLTSFRQRQSLGQAEDKVRAVLPAAVDLGRFARDQRYRQV